MRGGLFLVAACLTSPASALADDLPVDDAVVVETPAELRLFKQGKTFSLTDPNGAPLYVVSTLTFDKLLADGKNLRLCEEARGTCDRALFQAQRALDMSEDQLHEEERANLSCVEAVSILEMKNYRRTAERNLAVGVAGVLTVGVVVGLLIAAG